MNFDDAYQLLQFLESDSERETYTAREIATGAEVLMHLLSKNSGQTPSLLTMAERHLESQRGAPGLQLKIGTFQNEQCLITTSAAELRNIRGALEHAPVQDNFEKAKMWRVPAVKESVPDTPPKAAPVGEFTSMFSQPAAAAPPSSQGEFTRIFEASKPSPTVAAVPAPALERPPAPAGPAAPSPTEGGSFTQMFSAPPTKSEPGEFTRMFKGDSATPAPAVKPEISSAPTPKSGPGDFTRMFKPDATPPPVSKENWLDFAERPQQSNSLDSINWDSPQTQGATGAFAVRPAPVSAPPIEQGPSEFTRLISVPSSLPKQAENPAPAPAPPPEAPAQRTSNLPIIIALNVLLITAVALILYFVLRR